MGPSRSRVSSVAGVVLIGLVAADPDPAHAAATCNARIDVTEQYLVGQRLRWQICIGAGSIVGGGLLTIPFLEFDLDCFDDGLPPCTDDGPADRYEGDATIVNNCLTAGGIPVTFSSTNPAGGDTPNTLIFTASPPLELLANSPGCCLQFDTSIQHLSGDRTPNVVEAAARTISATCNNGLGASPAEAVGVPVELSSFGAAIATQGTNVIIGANLDASGVGTGNGLGAVYVFDDAGPSPTLVRRLLNPEPPGPLGNLFGLAVASFGSDIVVGAPGNDQGAGVAYRYSTTTGAVLSTFHNPSPPLGSFGLFGFAIASLGSQLVIGAPGNDATYIVDGASGAVVHVLADPDPPFSMNDIGFGASVTTVGATVVVGAPDKFPGGPDTVPQGAAYVFDGTTGRLLFTVMNPGVARGGFPSHGFGWSVAAVGNDAVLVGAPANDDDAGAAYLFDIASGALLTTIHNPGSPEPGSPPTSFGFSIASLAGKLLIGAPQRFGRGAGAGYLFDATTGALLQTFQDPSPADFDGFASAVGFVGNDVLIGSTNASGDGVAYAFDGQTAALRGAFERPRAGSLFGTSVAATATRLVVGAPISDQTAGAVFVFDPATGAVDRTIQNPVRQGGDQFGASVAGAASSILVGAPGRNIGGPGAGVAYVFADPNGAAVELRKPEPQSGDGFGKSVAFLGADILVGAPYNDTGATDAGAVYRFDGSSHALVRAFQTSPAIAGAFLGAAIAAAGADVVAGAPFDETTGAAYVFDASSGAVRRALRSPNPAPGALFGASVAASDTMIVVGAPLEEGRTLVPNAGAAYLFDTANGRVVPIRKQTPRAGDQFGAAVAILGSQIFVGVPLEDGAAGTVDSGAVYVYDGSGTLVSVLTAPQLVSRDQFGFSLARAASGLVAGAPHGQFAYLLSPCPGSCSPTTLLTVTPPASGPAAAIARSSPVASAGSDLSCVGGYCDDGDPCTDDFCDPTKGGCFHVVRAGCRCALDVQCDDRNLCNGTEECFSCLGCFLNHWSCCDTSSICVGTRPPAAGTSCEIPGYCAGYCTDGACLCEGPAVCPQNCDDGKACTTDTCVPGTGCVHAAAECDDGDSCTDDSCDDALGCVHAPKTGYAGITCVSDRLANVPACPTSAIPAGIAARINTAGYFLRKAHDINCALASGRGKKRSAKRVRSLLETTRRLVGQAATAAERIARRSRRPSKIKRDCAGALGEILRGEETALGQNDVAGSCGR